MSVVASGFQSCGVFFTVHEDRLLVSFAVAAALIAVAIAGFDVMALMRVDELPMANSAAV
jgi:hypothetical protein